MFVRLWNYIYIYIYSIDYWTQRGYLIRKPSDLCVTSITYHRHDISVIISSHAEEWLPALIPERPQKMEVLFYPMLPDFQNSTDFRTFPQTHPLALQVRVTRIWRRSISGIILTGETRRTRWKICTSATLSTTNPTKDWPGNEIRTTEVTGLNLS